MKGVQITFENNDGRKCVLEIEFNEQNDPKMRVILEEDHSNSYDGIHIDLMMMLIEVINK